MNDLIRIGNSDITIKEYSGQRVVTFKDIDIVHGRVDGTARKRFADNRKHFIENEDYFIVTPQILENAKMSEKRTTGIEEVNPRGTAFLTEQGYLMLVKSFTDDLAWQVQRQLVNTYFKKNEPQIDTSELSESLQAFQQIFISMAKQELETKRLTIEVKRANDTAEKAFKITENIKEAVQPVTDNWREKINAKFNRIQKNTDTPFSYLRNEMYQLLEQRAGCDLRTRLRNKRKRMGDSGCTKTQVDKTNKMDIIEEDKRLRQIFTTIVTEYEIKYCACEVEV